MTPIPLGSCRPCNAPHREATRRYCSKEKRKVAAWLRWIKEAVSCLVPLAKGKDFVLAEVKQAVYFRETQTRTNKQKKWDSRGQFMQNVSLYKEWPWAKGPIRFLSYSGGGEGTKVETTLTAMPSEQRPYCIPKVVVSGIQKEFWKNQTLKLSGVVPVCNPRTQGAKAEGLCTPEASLA